MFNKKSTYEKGLLAENIAKGYLKLLRFKILDTRLKNQFGEIDILAIKNSVIYIVEVKFRQSQKDALEAINKQSLMRSYAAFFHYANFHNIKYNDLKLLACVFSHKFPYFPKIFTINEL